MRSLSIDEIGERERLPESCSDDTRWEMFPCNYEETVSLARLVSCRLDLRCWPVESRLRTVRDVRSWISTEYNLQARKRTEGEGGWGWVWRWGVRVGVKVRGEGEGGWSDGIEIEHVVYLFSQVTDTPSLHWYRYQSPLQLSYNVCERLVRQRFCSRLQEIECNCTCFHYRIESMTDNWIPSIEGVTIFYRNTTSLVTELSSGVCSHSVIDDNAQFDVLRAIWWDVNLGDNWTTSSICS